VRLEGLDQFNELIGNQIRDHPACSMVPGPTTLSGAPRLSKIIVKTGSSKFVVTSLTDDDTLFFVYYMGHTRTVGQHSIFGLPVCHKILSPDGGGGTKPNIHVNKTEQGIH
jgi:hypothetical protein